MRLKQQLPIFILACTCLRLTADGQTVSPNLQAGDRWELINRTASPMLEKKAIRLNEAPGDGLMILKGSDFSEGTIELDIKGSHQIQQSFVGVAFHIQDDKTFDAIYFRPFNFNSNEAIRRSHAVQYISMPDNDWEKLRNQFTGKYEHGIEAAPDPDEWFHARIVVKGTHVAVYVNNAQFPSLEVEKISKANHGRLGLWVGNNSPGNFANLTYHR